MTDRTEQADRGIPENKTHHVGGCWLGQGWMKGPVRTMEVPEVTCRACLLQIERHKVRSRSEFPEIPRFLVNERRSFTCPVCRKLNTHGTGDGHRCSHCKCWEAKGYFIRADYFIGLLPKQDGLANHDPLAVNDPLDLLNEMEYALSAGYRVMYMSEGEAVEVNTVLLPADVAKR